MVVINRPVDPLKRDFCVGCGLLLLSRELRFADTAIHGTIPSALSALTNL